MKQTKLYSCLLALVMILLSGATAMAQELTLKTVTFLKPGEKATIAVGLKNSDVVDALQARIALPEGLTFVEKANNAKRFVINKTDRTQGMSLLMQKVDEKTAVMVGISSQIAAGEGDVFTFDVNVAPDYTGAADIKLSGVQLGVLDKPAHMGSDVVAKIANANDKVTVAGTVPSVTVGTAATVALTLSFDKTLMRGVAFNVELPQGVAIVDKSAKVGTLCPNHKINIKGNLVTLNVLDYFEDDTFAANSGELCSFDVLADETFVDGSEIKVSNVRSWAKGGADEYYAEDFAIKLTKGSATGINGVSADELGADGIYQMNGVRTDRMQQGVNIVVKNGKAVKVLKK